MKEDAGKVGKLFLPGNHGIYCCTEADCRPALAVKIEGEGANTRYLVFIRKLTAQGTGWRDGDDQWHAVPPDKIIPPKDRNGVTQAIACWTASRLREIPSSNGFYCFTPPTLAMREEPSRSKFASVRPQLTNRLG
jgi:hypothetical protein